MRNEIFNLLSGWLLKCILIYLLILFSFNACAQQCGYDNYYLFAINIHSKDSDEKITDLKMYLADEKGEPVRAEVLFMDGKKWKRENKILYFWDNSKLSKNDGTVPLVRRKFYNIGDCYVVVFRMNPLALKDPFKLPVYKVKIEGGGHPYTGNSYPSQEFHLSLNKAVRLCNSGILERFKPVRPVETFDGQPFMPINLVLDEYASPEVVAESESSFPRYAIRFDYDKSTNPAAYNREEFKITAADIYHVSTGKRQQRIDIPSNAITLTEMSRRVSDTGDFYGRQLKIAKDFSVLMDSWRDTVFSVERTKTNFYVFNTSSEKYELDSFLSRETDVFYYPPKKTMRRHKYLLTKQSKIINTYESEGKIWKLIDKREEFLPAFKPKIKYPPAACLLFSEKYHRLPVKAVVGTNSIIKVKDSFLIYNQCEDSINIISVKSPNRDFFSIDQALPPRQYTKLHFEGIIQSSSFDFNTKSYYCYLMLEDNTTLSFSIDVPVISNNAKIFYRDDSIVNYAVLESANKIFTKAILTYPDGNVRASGLVQNADTTLKVGKWQYFEKGDWKITEVFYSKAISLSALNGTSYYDKPDFKIKILQNGKWQTPLIQEENAQKWFYAREGTDSIVAYNDSLHYGFSFPYNEISDNIQMQFYLLKPGERTLKIGYYQTPFRTLEDSYAIIPDYSQIKNKNRTTYQITDSIIGKLEEEFPGLAQVYVSKSVRGISLAGLSVKDQKRLLTRLEVDRGISFVCMLFAFTDKESVTYCDNRVYVELNGRDPESLRKFASDLGFTGLQSDLGSNRYWLTYKSKMIDEAFFEAYEKLTRSPLVLSAYFNSYHEPELDNRLKPIND